MPDRTHANIATADVLTLLWEGQLACAAAIEELAIWVKSNGGSEAHDNVFSALEVLSQNGNAIVTGIMDLRG